MAGGGKKGTNALRSSQTSAATKKAFQNNAELKIAARRIQQEMNPEKFQGIIKNKKAVTNKLSNMGQDYKSINKVVTADRNNRRKTGSGEFRRANQAATTRARAKELGISTPAPRKERRVVPTAKRSILKR